MLNDAHYAEAEIVLSDAHKSTSPRGSGRGNRYKEKELYPVHSPVPIDKLHQMIEVVTGKRIKRSTLEGVLRFLTWAKKSSKHGVFEASRDLASDYVSRVTLKGGGTICLLPLMCRIGVLEKVSCHSVEDHRASKYRFLLSNWKTSKIHLTKTSRKKTKAAKTRRQQRIDKDSERNWVQESLNSSNLEERFLEGLGPGYLGSVKSIRSKNPWLKTNHGRITTAYSNLPSNTREQITINGEQVSRLDLTSSHLLMLARYFEDLIRDGNDPVANYPRFVELEEFRKLLESDDPYKALIPHIDRKKAKQEIQVFLNGTKNGYSRTGHQAVKDLFPRLAKTILSHLKSKPLGPILQTYENRVIRRVISRLKSLGIMVIPCVDEIIIPWSHRETAIHTFSEVVYEMTGVNPRIGGVRIPRSSNQSPDWWEEELMALLAS